MIRKYTNSRMNSTRSSECYRFRYGRTEEYNYLPVLNQEMYHYNTYLGRTNSYHVLRVAYLYGEVSGDPHNRSRGESMDCFIYYKPILQEHLYPFLDRTQREMSYQYELVEDKAGN